MGDGSSLPYVTYETEGKLVGSTKALFTSSSDSSTELMHIPSCAARRMDASLAVSVSGGKTKAERRT